MTRLDDGLKPGELILELAVLSPHPDPLPKGEGVKRKSNVLQSTDDAVPLLPTLAG